MQIKYQSHVVDNVFPKKLQLGRWSRLIYPSKRYKQNIGIAQNALSQYIEL